MKYLYQSSNKKNGFSVKIYVRPFFGIKVKLTTREDKKRNKYTYRFRRQLRELAFDKAIANDQKKITYLSTAVNELLKEVAAKTFAKNRFARRRVLKSVPGVFFRHNIIRNSFIGALQNEFNLVEKKLARSREKGELSLEEYRTDLNRAKPLIERTLESGAVVLCPNGGSSIIQKYYAPIIKAIKTYDDIHASEAQPTITLVDEGKRIYAPSDVVEGEAAPTPVVEDEAAPSPVVEDKTAPTPVVEESPEATASIPYKETFGEDGALIPAGM